MVWRKPAGVPSALAGDGDEFIAAGMMAIAGGRRRDRAGDFVRIDAAIGGGLGKIPGLAIGAGGMGAAFLASGEALVDPVAIRLVGDDEDTAVGRRRRRGEQEHAGQER